MEICFADKKLHSALSDERARTKAFGQTTGKKLGLRLSQLSAAADLATMRTLPGRCHELKGDRHGQLAIDVTANLRLVFRPSTEPPPSKRDGGLDWAGVTSITILEVTDYHGG